MYYYILILCTLRRFVGRATRPAADPLVGLLGRSKNSRLVAAKTAMWGRMVSCGRFFNRPSWQKLPPLSSTIGQHVDPAHPCVRTQKRTFVSSRSRSQIDRPRIIFVSLQIQLRTGKRRLSEKVIETVLWLAREGFDSTRCFSRQASTPCTISSSTEWKWPFLISSCTSRSVSGLSCTVTPPP